MAAGVRAAVAAALVAAAAAAQDGPIQDNSFLVEEAYNQEAGIVQHISTLDRPDEGSDATFSFTQEWPLAGRRHQLSYTLGAARFGGDESVEDLALHYRYMLAGVDGGPLAVAPRVTLLLPTGEDEEGLGSGTTGVQVNLPVSLELGDRWVAHWNAGGTWSPDAKSPLGDEADTSAVQLGQSLIFLARPRLNLMLEAVWERASFVTGPGATDDEESFFVSPGVRFAFDRPSGLQIVPGFAVPIGVGPSDGELSVFFYLSLEHPFGR